MAKKPIMDMSIEELKEVDVEKASAEHNKGVREKNIEASRQRVAAIKKEGEDRKAKLRAEANKPNWVQKLKSKVKRTLSREKKSSETARTKTVSNDLKKAGLTDEEISRMKGKK